MGSRASLYATLAAATTLLSLAGPAVAETVVVIQPTVIQNLTVDLSVPWTLGTVPESVNQRLSFAPFDTSLGTLLSARASIDYIHELVANRFVTFISEDPYSGEGQWQVFSTLSVTVDGISAITSDLNGSDSFTNFQALGSATVFRNGSTDDSSFESLPVGLNYDIDLRVHDIGCGFSSNNPSVGITSECGMSGIATSTAKVRLIYEYSPVPLPANFGLLALGLGGLGYLQRRR